MLITTFDQQIVDTLCISCSIFKKEIIPFGGIIYESNYFLVSQDVEIPIPGFLVISPKRHLYSLLEFSSEELAEFNQILVKTRNALQQVASVNYITLIQKEINPHFHLWLFPKYDWMDKFNYNNLSGITRSLKYASQNLKTAANLKIISDLNSKIKNFMNQ